MAALSSDDASEGGLEPRRRPKSSESCIPCQTSKKRCTNAVSGRSKESACERCLRLGLSCEFLDPALRRKRGPKSAAEKASLLPRADRPSNSKKSREQKSAPAREAARVLETAPRRSESPPGRQQPPNSIHNNTLNPPMAPLAYGPSPWMQQQAFALNPPQSLAGPGPVGHYYSPFPVDGPHQQFVAGPAPYLQQTVPHQQNGFAPPHSFLQPQQQLPDVPRPDALQLFQQTPAPYYPGHIPLNPAIQNATEQLYNNSLKVSPGPAQSAQSLSSAAAADGAGALLDFAGSWAASSQDIVDSLYLTLFGRANPVFPDFPDETPPWDNTGRNTAWLNAECGTTQMGITSLLSPGPEGQLRDPNLPMSLSLEEMLDLYREHVMRAVIPIFCRPEQGGRVISLDGLPQGLLFSILALTSLYVPPHLLPQSPDSFYRAAATALFPPSPSIAAIQALMHLALFAAAMKSVRVGDGYIGMAHNFARGIKLNKPEGTVPQGNDAESMMARARETERRRAWQFLFFLDRAHGTIMNRQFLIRDEEVSLMENPVLPEDLWLDWWVKQGKVFGHASWLTNPTMAPFATTVANLQNHKRVVEQEIADLGVNPDLVGESNARWMRLAMRRTELLVQRSRFVWKAIPSLRGMVDAVFGPEKPVGLFYPPTKHHFGFEGTIGLLNATSYIYKGGYLQLDIIPPFQIYPMFYVCVVTLADPVIAAQEELSDEPVPFVELPPGSEPRVGKGTRRFLGLLESATPRYWSCARALAVEVRRRIGGIVPKVATTDPRGGYVLGTATWDRVWDGVRAVE